MIKYIGQIIGGFLYSIIYTGIIYTITVFPLAYILLLPTWAIIVTALLCGGILFGIYSFFTSIGLVPFAWIIRNNKVAYGLSITTVIVYMLRNIYTLWSEMEGPATYVFIIEIIATIILIWFVCISVMGIIHLYNIK